MPRLPLSICRGILVIIFPSLSTICISGPYPNFMGGRWKCFTIPRFPPGPIPNHGESTFVIAPMNFAPNRYRWSWLCVHRDHLTVKMRVVLHTLQAVRLTLQVSGHGGRIFVKTIGPLDADARIGNGISFHFSITRLLRRPILGLRKTQKKINVAHWNPRRTYGSVVMVRVPNGGADLLLHCSFLFLLIG